VLRRRVLLTLIGACQVLNVVGGMVITDELHRIGDGLYEVVFFDQGSHEQSGKVNGGVGEAACAAHPAQRMRCRRSDVTCRSRQAYASRQRRWRLPWRQPT